MTSEKKHQQKDKKSEEEAAAYELFNPKTDHYEFGGPIGAFGMVTILPLVVLFFSTCCDSTGYPSQEFQDNWWKLSSLSSSKTEAFLTSLFDPSAFFVYIAYMSMLAFFYIDLPADTVPGTVLRDGSKLKYRLNGPTSYVTTLFVALCFIVNTGLEPLEYAYYHFTGLAFASIIFSYILSLAVYLGSFRSGKLLALGGNTGNYLYDFVIGRELNPRVGSFDIKFFIELRPGMIGWSLINYCLAAKQYIDLGYITNTMVLVQFFQSWYVLDSLWNEKAILTTIDITTDGFGFMLAFGLCSWIPFTYTLQARYLVDFPRSISWIGFSCILAVNFISYFIFRSANSEKNEFRSNPDSLESKKLKYIQTKTGSKLIISGWWGMSGHINYLGDWMMALSWSLPCGFKSIVPYFYPIYFAISLLHRERRDDHKCRTNYGADWEEYCKTVKYRIIPGIY